MKQTILSTNIFREKGFLYFTGTDEKGNITLCKVEVAHGRKKKEVKE